jgi:hypothetical protein
VRVESQRMAYRLSCILFPFLYKRYANRMLTFRHALGGDPGEPYPWNLDMALSQGCCENHVSTALTYDEAHTRVSRLSLDVSGSQWPNMRSEWDVHGIRDASPIYGPPLWTRL